MSSDTRTMMMIGIAVGVIACVILTLALLQQTSPTETGSASTVAADRDLRNSIVDVPD